MKEEVVLQGGEYKTLLDIADKAFIMLSSSENLDVVKNNNLHWFRDDQLLYIILDYSISACEGFINHLGFIFDEQWAQFETKGFAEQYKRLTEILSMYAPSILRKEGPFIEFATYRAIRNRIHHVHASKHDHIHHSSEKEFSIDSFNDNSLAGKLLSAHEVPKESAEGALTGVREFISNTHKELIIYSGKITQFIRSSEARRGDLWRKFQTNPFADKMAIKTISISG